MENYYFYPPLLKRAQALVFDALVLMASFILFYLLFNQFETLPVWMRGVCLIFMIYIYEPLLLSLFGGTLGHHIAGIRVKHSTKEYQNLSFFQGLIRFLFKGLLGWLSFLTITFNKRKRAIHDMVSSSIVIYKDDREYIAREQSDEAEYSAL